MAENSALVDANVSGWRGLVFVKTGGPDWVRSRWLTLWQGLEAVNPSEDTTSGNSERRLEIQFRVARSLALRWAAVGSWEAGRMMEVEVGESALRTLWLDTSYRRLCYLRKSAPRIGIATRASWKGKSKLWFPKHREIMREPEQESEELSAVSRLTPDLEVDGKARKTKIKAPESTRNLLELSESWR